MLTTCNEQLTSAYSLDLFVIDKTSKLNDDDKNKKCSPSNTVRDAVDIHVIFKRSAHFTSFQNAPYRTCISLLQSVLTYNNVIKFIP